MKLQCIFAMNEDQIIGVNNSLPWNIPEDLRRFRTITLNSIVVMGRKTLESLPNGQPLKGRINVVLTRTPSKYTCVGNTLLFVDSTNVFDLLEKLNPDNSKKIFIIGGEDIFSLFLPNIHTIYLTMVYSSLPNTQEYSVITKFPISFTQIKQEYSCTHSSIIQEAIEHNFTYQFFTFVRGHFPRTLSVDTK